MISSGSVKTVAASSNETLCFLWLRRFFVSSHSTSDVVLPRFTLAFLPVLVLFSSFTELKGLHAKSKISGIPGRQEYLPYARILSSVNGSILRHQGQS